MHCIIDGDSNVFAEFLTEKGVTGGVEAARRLSDSIKDYVDQSGLGSSEGKQFWVSIFFSRPSFNLQNTPRSQDVTRSVEQFYLGFTRDSPRFLLINPGFAKQTTDSKLRGARLKCLWHPFSVLTINSMFGIIRS